MEERKMMVVVMVVYVCVCVCVCISSLFDLSNSVLGYLLLGFSIVRILALTITAATTATTSLLFPISL